ncbi:hypothetical protein [Burkholderia ambifaria]|uniref:hypothetical protein n=1 Tax=Burkholderia ambifaria TaxID=152480 RepID=UPI000F812B08|nr:hypothetical protein [Burkholderia ambifaria]
MVEVLDLLGELFADILMFQLGLKVAVVVGVLWLAVYAGGQLELADVQACQVHAACTITTDKGLFSLPVRHLTPAPAQVSVKQPSGK